jgi:hypothetical protein
MDLISTRSGFSPAARSTNIGGYEVLSGTQAKPYKNLFLGGSELSGCSAPQKLPVQSHDVATLRSAAIKIAGNDFGLWVTLPSLAVASACVRTLGISGVPCQEPERRDFL